MGHARVTLALWRKRRSRFGNLRRFRRRTPPVDPVTYERLVREAKTRIREVDATAARARLDAADGVAFLDVREPMEVARGTVPGAVVVPLGSLHLLVEGALPAKGAEIVVLCQRGNRSALAADSMQGMGYTNVTSLQGGFMAWAMGGHPVGRPRA
jgi:rhodanese-related sulfurtransferase